MTTDSVVGFLLGVIVCVLASVFGDGLWNAIDTAAYWWHVKAERGRFRFQRRGQVMTKRWEQPIVLEPHKEKEYELVGLEK